MKIWILYSLDFGYPEDPAVTAEFFKVCKDEKEARDIEKLTSESNLCNVWHPSIQERVDKARKQLKEKYNLSHSDVPSDLKIMEGEIEDVTT